jgi:hypothetical protein
VQQWLVLSTTSYSNNLVTGRLTQAGTDKHKNILTIVADEMSTCFGDILKQYFKDGENIVYKCSKELLKNVENFARLVRILLTKKRFSGFRILDSFYSSKSP